MQDQREIELNKLQRELQEQLIEMSCRNSTTQQSILDSSRDITFQHDPTLQIKKVKINEKLKFNLKLNSHRAKNEEFP